jgi:hypothetical protein
MALFQMFYVSTMLDQGTAAFPAIHEASVRNNLRRKVTGMLLYAEGGILQVLEGEKADVLETFNAIEHDPRHHGIIVLLEEAISERQFPAWSMGFKHLTATELQQCPNGAEVFQGRREHINARVLQGYARTILQSFGSYDRTEPGSAGTVA